MACYETGLDLWDWEQGIYPHKFKAKIIAFWQDYKLVNAHQEDAQYVKPKK